MILAGRKSCNDLRLRMLPFIESYINCHLEQGCPTRGPWATVWPAMLSGVAHFEIKAVKKLHGGKNFDAITNLHHNYFGS